MKENVLRIMKNWFLDGFYFIKTLKTYKFYHTSHIFKLFEGKMAFTNFEMSGGECHTLTDDSSIEMSVC